MPNRSLMFSFKAHWWLSSILLSAAIPAVAHAPAPSQEFWEYMTDFSDENGEVVDPLEYDELLQLKENGDAGTVKKDIQNNTIGDGIISSALAAKNMSRSSAQTSSVATKGTK